MGLLILENHVYLPPTLLVLNKDWSLAHGRSLTNIIKLSPLTSALSLMALSLTRPFYMYVLRLSTQEQPYTHLIRRNVTL